MASIVSEKIAWGRVLFEESMNPGPPIRFWPISMQPCANIRNESSECETHSKACKRLLFGFLQTHRHFNTISEVVTELEQITKGHCTCGNQGFPELVYLGNPNNETWPRCGTTTIYCNPRDDTTECCHHIAWTWNETSMKMMTTT